MRFRFKVAVWLISMVMSLAMFNSAHAQSAGAISKIIIDGNLRIEASTVKSYLLFSVGSVYNRSRVDKSLKALFNTGLFADVAIRRNKSAVIITVVENPIINRLAFEGNRNIDDNALSVEVQLRPRIVYTRARVQNDVQRIITVYRRSGRFAAIVEPKVIQLPENRVDLIFEINEGEKTAIKKIRFIGNKRYDDGQLREQISTEETRWYRFLSDSDTFDPDRLTYDRELLRKFYLGRGYADFTVTSAIADLTPDRDGFFITFSVKEGEIYRFGDINLKSNIKEIEPDILKQLLVTRKGEIYSADAIEKSIQKLTFELGKLGYAFVNIRPKVERDKENRTISLNYQINKGPRVYVERINITGNVRTLDHVIRREMRLIEGDAFNTALLRRSNGSIRSLNFFDTVEIDRIDGSEEDKTIINVNVQEKSTGELTIGAGFSTTESFSGDIQVRERNLLGKGQDLKLGFSLGSVNQQIELSFTEPYFMNRDLSAGFDIFNTQRDLSDESGYNLDKLGFRLRAGFPIQEKWRARAFYSLINEEISDVSSSASTVIQRSEGETLISSIGYKITYRDLDNFSLPTTGSNFTFGQTFSGLGGDVHSIKNTAEYTRFFPVMDKVVFSISGKGGIIFGLGEDVILAQRFQLGGRTFRGFEKRGIGPRDIASTDALGGNIYAVSSAEIRFPVGLPEEFGVLGRTFLDVGTLTQIDGDTTGVVDDASIRASAGIGFNWTSPFGPIQVNFSYPLMKEDYDKDEVFQFDFGTRF